MSAGAVIVPKPSVAMLLPLTSSARCPPCDAVRVAELAGPCAEGAGNESIGLGAGQNRAQVSLVGEVLHRGIGPHQILAFDSGSVARARDKRRAPGAAGHSTTNKKTGNRQNSPGHGSLLISGAAISGAADGPLQLNDADASDRAASAHAERRSRHWGRERPGLSIRPLGW